MDFDGKRYWDMRENMTYPVQGKPLEESLISDSRRRPDCIALKSGNIEQAQTQKDILEDIQRKDRQLREAAQKRREKGGPKHVMPGELSSKAVRK